MYYVILNQNKAYAMVCDKPTEDINFLEFETEEKAIACLGKIWTGKEFIEPLTEEEQERLNLKTDLEYIKCLEELQIGI
ncbi:MAG: hypothetical protein K2F59_00870 [Eubacteriales bacterium]|nr:hypothetical protein [Eubacteriales bacterium]